ARFPANRSPTDSNPHAPHPFPTSMQYLTRLLVAAVLAAISLNSPAAEPAAATRWLPASPEKLPRWRGFNLLEKFHIGSGRKPFLEEDFRLISKLGFNFVRLPMDYRGWIKDG